MKHNFETLSQRVSPTHLTHFSTSFSQSVPESHDHRWRLEDQFVNRQLSHFFTTTNAAVHSSISCSVLPSHAWKKSEYNWTFPLGAVAHFQIRGGNPTSMVGGRSFGDSVPGGWTYHRLNSHSRQIRPKYNIFYPLKQPISDFFHDSLNVRTIFLQSDPGLFQYVVLNHIYIWWFSEWLQSERSCHISFDF